MAKGVSVQNSNLKDLPLIATTGGVTAIVPRVSRSVPATGLDYGVGEYTVHAIAEANAFADVGTYWRASTAIGTPLAYSVTTAFSQFAAFLLLQNKNAAAGANLYLDFIRLLLTTAPASATAAHYAIRSDPTNRLNTGGTTLTNGNVNTASAATTSTVATAGTPTANAEGGSVRTISRGQLRTVIPVVGDQYVFQFGDNVSSQASALNGTNPQIIQVQCPPLILGPGNNHTALLHLWFPGNVTTPPQFEVEIGWWERT